MIRRTTGRVLVALVLGSALLALSACSSYGAAVTAPQSVDRGDARSVRANIDLGSGTLAVRGGAQALMDGSFTYNEKLKPAVTYKVKDGQGTLEVKQPARNLTFNFTRMKNDWDIGLNGGVPINLGVTTRSGDANLDLTNLSLTRLAFTSTSGDSTLNLGGDQKLLSSVRVESSSGKVNLVMNGTYARLSTLNVESASNHITLDLNGKWATDFFGTVHASSGSVTVRVPKDVGVSINAWATDGKVKATGLKAVDGAYVNDAYGKAPVTMRLEISIASGDIMLEQAK